MKFRVKLKFWNSDLGHFRIFIKLDKNFNFKKGWKAPNGSLPSGPIWSFFFFFSFLSSSISLSSLLAFPMSFFLIDAQLPWTSAMPSKPALSPFVFLSLFPSLSFSSPEPFSLCFFLHLALDGIAIYHWWAGQLGSDATKTPRANSTKPQSSMWRHVTSHNKMAFKHWSTGLFDGDPWFHRVQYNFLFNMVPFVFYESARIIGTYFRAIKNFASKFESNRALFWGNDPEFVLLMKNVFQRYMICLCLVVICKKLNFSRQTVKIAS